MIDLAPTPATLFMESATRLTDKIAQLADQLPGLGSTLGNTAIFADSTSTTCRAAINCCAAPNIVAKSFFAASFACGLVGAASSGSAIASSFIGLPKIALVGAASARAFNRAGKYALYMGNVTNGNITNVTEIANLME